MVIRAHDLAVVALDRPAAGALNHQPRLRVGQIDHWATRRPAAALAVADTCCCSSSVRRASGLFLLGTLQSRLSLPENAANRPTLLGLYRSAHTKQRS